MADHISVEELKELLKEATDEVEDSEASAAASVLHGLGLKRKRHLSKVTVEDLQTAGLNIFVAREVYEAWQTTGNTEQSQSQATVQGSQQVVSAAATVTQPTQPTQGTSRAGSRPECMPQCENVQNFRINWELVYTGYDELKKHLETGQRLTPEDRIQVVSSVVLQVRAQIPGVTRGTFDKVYSEHMAKGIYKKSFQETLGTETEGLKVKVPSGVLHQLKNKFDNDTKRPPSRERRTRIEVEQPRYKEAYGCVRWKVIENPPGETNESLEAKKELLKVRFQERRTNRVNPMEVKNLLTATYKLQRDMINKNVEAAIQEQRHRRRGPRRQTAQQDQEGVQGEEEEEETIKIEDIRREFPYLFSYAGMDLHHTLLTDTNCTQAMDKFCDNELDSYISFFNTSKNPVIQSIQRKLQRHLKLEGINVNFTKMLALLWMVTEELKEDISSLVKLVPEDTDVMQLRTSLRPEPHLIAKGRSLLSAKSFFLAIDQLIVATHTNVTQTLCLLYMPYFVFNLNYSPMAQTTLEYMQRCIFKHSPSAGHKRPTERAQGGNFTTVPFHPKVAALNRKFNDFLQALVNSSVEEE